MTSRFQERLAAQLRVAAERRPRLSSRRRGAEGWPTGGAVFLPAPPIGQPSDRSIGAQSRFRSEKAAGAAADPSRDASSSSALQCAEKRRGGARLAMHDDGSAGCSSAGPVAPYSRVTCRRPDDSLAPPLMEGRSAPLPPRRRWERHWWWPGRPSAAARRARAAVAACAAPASSGRPRFERAPPASSGRPGRVPRFERADAAGDSLSEMSASKGETTNLISESLLGPRTSHGV